ncbi:amino acid ABC transporter substrate-binding protein [Lacticaseibacillus nasuensis]|uniref:amino acid ABC transporter substrate-binding protein n=1 Tax=Lacticaseibacillus nasuensis TaxID=944671 RepID=UPI0006D21D4E|nr:amino acid ABC transporter substrate-binding protein [Lacticaseibacillus nasuensis]MCX2454783.1 amino acid ABC transporter substrate-binding protein [Lacticaseibacillus nasuensis]
MRKWLIGLLAGLALFATAGCARTKAANSWPRIQQDKTVVVGLDDSFVPMGFRAKSGKLEGFDIDLAKAVFKLYGVKVSFQPIEWSMKETELKNQTIDLIWNGYSVTPERAKQVRFSDDYLVNHQLLVTKRKDNVTSFAAMKGKTLGVQTGSSGAAALDAKPKLLKQYIAKQNPVLYDTFTDAFLDLNAGRIQGIFMDEVYARYYIAHQPDPSSYRVLTGDFDAEDFAVGMRKSDTELQQKINAGFKTLTKNGTMAKLKHKWFGNAAD